MSNLHRVAVRGTKGKNRQYLSSFGGEVELTDRTNALHWDRAIAKLIVKELNTQFEHLGRDERFEIEKGF